MNHAQPMINPLVLIYILRGLASAALTMLGVHANIVVEAILKAVPVTGHDWQIPTGVMQSFQLAAWGGAVAAAGFTCYGVWKTHHGKRKRGKK